MMNDAVNQEPKSRIFQGSVWFLGWGWGDAGTIAQVVNHVVDKHEGLTSILRSHTQTKINHNQSTVACSYNRTETSNPSGSLDRQPTSLGDSSRQIRVLILKTNKQTNTSTNTQKKFPRTKPEVVL